PSITGEKIGALAITEPFGGSDVAGMKSTAIKKDDHYLLNGSKTFITNGVYGDYIVVAAKTNPEKKHRGMSMIVVDTNTPGLQATKLDKLGWRASDTDELSFTDLTIRLENLMGEEV